MRGLLPAALGIAFLNVASASMRFTAMSGIYPLEVSLLVRHLFTVAMLVAAAVAVSRMRVPPWGRRLAAIGMGCSLLLSACLSLSNADVLIAGGGGIPAYIASVAVEAASAMVLVVWIGLLMPLGLRRTLTAFGVAVLIQAVIQLVTCWLQYIPHLVLISVAPLASAACLFVFASAEPLDSTVENGGEEPVTSAARARPALVLLFCFMFILGHIIYMSLDTQQAMAGSPFAEISIGVGNMVGAIAVLAAVQRLDNQRFVSTFQFVTTAAIGLAFYLSTFVTGIAVGIYLAISSAVLQPVYAFSIFYAMTVLNRGGARGRLFGFLVVMIDFFLAKCLSSAFMVIGVPHGGVMYNIAVVVALAVLTGCCTILSQESSLPPVTPMPQKPSEDIRRDAATTTMLPTPDVALTVGTEESHPQADRNRPTPFRSAIDAVAEEARLTAQERNVLTLLAQGRNAKSISDAMVLSTNTVKSHMRNVYAKIGVHSQQELIDSINERVEGLRQALLDDGTLDAQEAMTHLPG